MARAQPRDGEPGRPDLRVAGSRSTAPTRIVERPEAQVPSEVDPLFAVAVRAFLLDAGILGTSMSLYVGGDDPLPATSTTHLDAADRGRPGRLVAAADHGPRRLRGPLPRRRLRGVQAPGDRDGDPAGRRSASPPTCCRSRPPLRLVLPSLFIGLMLLLLGRWLLRVWLGQPAGRGSVPAEHAGRR